jgi:undecaprenyl-diphosphatase
MLAGKHPAITFVAVLVPAFVAFAALSIGIGFLVTHLLLHVAGVNSADENAIVWLAQHRTSTGTDASFVGSSIAGGQVLPILVGSIALVCLLRRQWRIAAFIVFALVVESALYRATTLVIHRHRPNVVRLEHLQVNASYPSGHTAAAVAVYAGLVLLLTSRFKNGALRTLAWTIAIAIPLFVAASRMYRGMHHPIDTVGGAAVGVAAVIVVVFACRVAGATAKSWKRGSGAVTPPQVEEPQ